LGGFLFCVIASEALQSLDFLNQFVMILPVLERGILCQCCHGRHFGPIFGIVRIAKHFWILSVMVVVEGAAQ